MKTQLYTHWETKSVWLSFCCNIHVIAMVWSDAQYLWDARVKPFYPAQSYSDVCIALSSDVGLVIPNKSFSGNLYTRAPSSRSPPGAVIKVDIPFSVKNQTLNTFTLQATQAHRIQLFRAIEINHRPYRSERLWLCSKSFIYKGIGSMSFANPWYMVAICVR